MQIREHIKILLNKKIKDEKVVTQRALAEACNVSPAAITKWLNGIGIPDVEIIPTVCKILEITLEEFFGVNTVELSSEDLKLLKKIKDNPALKDVVERY